MFETEANNRTEQASQLPSDILPRFGELRGQIVGRSALPWSEHCTECVWPTCYSTCDLYSPRLDGRCQRFMDGMVRIDVPEAINRYVLKIRFKRWGKLWTPGSARVLPVGRADSMEKWDRRIGSFLVNIALPKPVKRLAIRRRYSYKKSRASRGGRNGVLPTCFILECFNPSPTTINLSFAIRSAGDEYRIPFQKLLLAKPGFNRFRIAMEEIGSVVDVHCPIKVELIPNEISDGETLYFGLADFVQEAAETGVPSKPIKCVVWDLDHVLWEGVLVEDGVQGLRVKPRVVEVIKELDRRGVLHSIASKNNAEEALEVLKTLGIEEFFLYPQISWNPKSKGIKAIAEALNIGLDSLLFIDDSVFELEEVKGACPGVRVLPADDCGCLPARKEFPAKITKESTRRRQMYRQESVRRSVAEAFGTDYLKFLQDCEMQLRIHPMSTANLERVHELTQRTNQMNFSGNRYDRSVLARILASPDLQTYVLECEDRYGSYGVVGFAIVDIREPRLTDLMFSCRIQSKRVEHAFLAFLIQRYTKDTPCDFRANYRKTNRNAASGQVFADMGMEEEGCRDGVTSLVFRFGRPVPDDNIVRVIDCGPAQEDRARASRPALRR